MSESTSPAAPVAPAVAPAAPAAPAAASPVVAPAAAAPTAQPARTEFPVTLDEFCAAHSKVRRGEVELLAAFSHVMRATGSAKPQTPSAWAELFKTFESSHKPI